MSEARLNVQGLARTDSGINSLPGLCSYILPDEGCVFVSQDLSAGEPSVTAHYSRDEMYRYATLDGVGKAPYWKDGRLYIDDIYLMVAASTPIGRPEIEAAWQKDWGGQSFAEQWLADPEVVKKHLGKTRKLHKTCALALGYGMGAHKMQKQVLEQFGVELTEEQCRGIHRGYWDTFSGVRIFSSKCQDEAKKRGYIINAFGYRITFNNSGERGKDTTHKAYNYLIQSSVSGMMHIYTMFLFEEAVGLGARLTCVIHDEIVCQVPEANLEAFRAAKERAVTRLNTYLNWTVPIRVGFTPGKTFFDAK
jgi:hypothetical protein